MAGTSTDRSGSRSLPKPGESCLQPKGRARAAGRRPLRQARRPPLRARRARSSQTPIDSAHENPRGSSLCNVASFAFFGANLGMAPAITLSHTEGFCGRGGVMIYYTRSVMVAADDRTWSQAPHTITSSRT